MSEETFKWLNTMQLIGYSKKRGTAWHYRAEDQGVEPNHYPEEIPVDDAVRRLFNFHVEKSSFYVPVPVAQKIETFTREKHGAAWKYTAVDSPDVSYLEVPGRVALVTSDTHEVLGVHRDGYTIHDPETWLLRNVEKMVGDNESDLHLAGCGLLKNRAVAWAQFELPETMQTPEGLEFRPFLTAQTSYDGTLPTDYFTGAQVVVCDNTLRMAAANADRRFRVRHTRYSEGRLRNAADALGLVLADAENVKEEVAKLAAWKVDNREFDLLLDAIMPVNEDGLSKKAVTMNEARRESILSLYRKDERAAQWTGTALGVLQAFNTERHHESRIHEKTNRAQKNMLDVLTGVGAKKDAEILKVLASVTS